MILPLVLLVVQDISTLPRAAPAPQAGSAQPEAKDLSDYLLLVAADAGGGLDSEHPHHANAFAGIKIGVPLELKRGDAGRLLRTATLDLGYDRMQTHNGFSAELSLMLPAARFPTPHTSKATYARVYLELGAGYRTGGGRFGCYASAKAMLVLFSDDRLTLSDAPPSFFVEIQHRFPLTSPRRGDTRVVIGLMTAICNHCGLN